MMTDGAAPLLGIRDLRVDFQVEGDAVLQAVKGVSFDIPGRGTVALVGESGSGKSVTGLAILGLLPRSNAIVHPESRIEYAGENLLGLAPERMVAVRGAEISMVFQEPMSSLNPVFTAGFQLIEVLRKHARLTARQAR